MSKALVYAFLFYIGSSLGWVLEVFFRRFKTSNTERKWVNPGFLSGPYLPLYGFGLCGLYALSKLYDVLPPGIPLWGEILLVFFISATVMTILELIAGQIFILGFKVKLWDYSTRWGNYKGIICPLFYVIWGLLGTVYNYAINPYIINAIDWLSRNLVFSFFIGAFFGVFFCDLVYTLNLAANIRKLAKDSKIVVRYEEFKERVREREGKRRGRKRFWFSFLSPANSLKENLDECQNDSTVVVNRKIKKGAAN